MSISHLQGVVLLLLAGSVNADGPTFIKPKALAYRSDFLSEAPGTLAFLPGIGDSKKARDAYEWRVMPTTGFYSVPPRGVYVFEIRNAVEEEGARFVECIIYTIYPKGEALKTPVYLTRDVADWHGRAYQDGKARALSKRVLKINLENSIDEFRAKHDLDDLKAVDEFTKNEKWHAWPDSTEDGSWDLRKRLAVEPPSESFGRLLAACGLTKDTVDICLTVQLIRFTPSSSWSITKQRLVFQMTGDNARGAYVHIESPSAFSKDFYLKFN